MIDDRSEYHLPKWQIEHSEELLDARIFKVRRNRSTTPDRKRSGTFYVLDSPDWVSVVPITTDGKVVLVAQYRHGTGSISLETPAGLIETSETP